jgi:ribosomal protein L25 (general stress protein Ctc)
MLANSIKKRYKSGFQRIRRNEVKMEDLVTIQGFLREETGKGYCRKLRNKDRVPANLLGADRKDSLLEIEGKWLSKAWQNGKKFNLQIGETVKPVLIKELQISAVKRKALHVDLQSL